MLITFVTVAVFIYLEVPRENGEPQDSRIEFTAARLFASLALFNQLTVPLFIFPITIPIILSAVVSTARLEAFLCRPEVRTVVNRRRSVEQFRRTNRRMRGSSKSGASLDTSMVNRDQEDKDEIYLNGEEKVEEDDTRWEQEGAMHFECFDLPECGKCVCLEIREVISLQVSKKWNYLQQIFNENLMMKCPCFLCL